MKRLALLLIATVALAGTASAQPAGSAPPPGAPNAGASPPQPMITRPELAELNAARDAALKANPNLLVEHQKLMERIRAFEDKLDAAIVKSDPTLAPTIARIEATLRQPAAPPAGAPPPSTPPPAK